MGEKLHGEYEDAGGIHGFTVEQIAEMTRPEKVRMMTDWFRAHFEDPAERTPYETAEGGYQWIWGGPHDAMEELQDQFSGVLEDDLIDVAVDEIQRDGYEWAPRSRASDYDDDDIADSLPDNRSEGIEGRPPRPGSFGRAVTEPEARQEVLRRLAELEELIQPLVERHGLIGHNRPPEPIPVEQPCSREEWLALSEAVSVIRQQAESRKPDEQAVEEASSTIARLAQGLATWLRVRAEKGIDAALVACGTAAGATAVIDLPKVVDAMHQVSQAVNNWLLSLSWPF